MKTLALSIAVLACAIYFRPLSGHTVKAADTSTVTIPPQVQRFQVVELQQTAVSHWSGLLDTQTGCVWEYAADKDGSHREWQFVDGASIGFSGASAGAMCQLAMFDALPKTLVSVPPHPDAH